VLAPQGTEMMKEPDNTIDKSKIALIVGIAFLTYIVFIFFIQYQDEIGLAASGLFFIFYSAEHIYNYINRTTVLAVNKFKDTIFQKGLAFGVPSVIIVITLLVGNGVLN